MDIDVILNILVAHWNIILLFIVIAFTYSSIGFGGGSSYLAILSVSGLAFEEIRIIALLCNILVVAGNVYQFHKEHIFNYKKIIPIIACSIPFAFVGGLLKITATFFFVLLGFTLLLAAISMWFSKATNIPNSKKNTSRHREPVFGSAIGFLSGMVGIGGGIFLAPLLHLTHWDTPKKIAATASLFILANSISGLFGQLLQNHTYFNWKLIIFLLLAVFIGGQLGNLMRTKLFSPILLKKATAILIAYISLSILYRL